jgi:hypothetical protein
MANEPEGECDKVPESLGGPQVGKNDEDKTR